ncbi:MAG: hypothetical protein R3C49_02075 [Planctomycetaceae bacterium]
MFLSPSELIFSVISISLLGPFGMALAAKQHSDRGAGARPSQHAIRQRTSLLDSATVVKWLISDFHEVTEYSRAGRLRQMAAIFREVIAWIVVVTLALNATIAIIVLTWLLMS